MNLAMVASQFVEEWYASSPKAGSLPSGIFAESLISVDWKVSGAWKAMAHRRVDDPHFYSIARTREDLCFHSMHHHFPCTINLTF